MRSTLKLLGLFLIILVVFILSKILLYMFSGHGILFHHPVGYLIDVIILFFPYYFLMEKNIVRWRKLLIAILLMLITAYMSIYFLQQYSRIQIGGHGPYFEVIPEIR